MQQERSTAKPGRNNARPAKYAKCVTTTIIINYKNITQQPKQLTMSKNVTVQNVILRDAKLRNAKEGWQDGSEALPMASAKREPKNIGVLG